jgi:ubiquitin carboxyl-terminal hydrolase 4/11/15
MENGGGVGGGSCLPCTPEEEKQIVEELNREAERDLKEGNLYFVVSSR